MKYRGDITPEAYAAMEEGYEQGVADVTKRVEALLVQWDQATRGETVTTRRIREVLTGRTGDSPAGEAAVRDAREAAQRRWGTRGGQ